VTGKDKESQTRTRETANYLRREDSYDSSAGEEMCERKFQSQNIKAYWGININSGLFPNLIIRSSYAHAKNEVT
jgi:hypothetical protein